MGVSWNGFFWKDHPDGHSYIGLAPARDNLIEVDAVKMYMTKPFKAEELRDLLRYGNVRIYPREPYEDGMLRDVFEPYADCSSYETAEKIRRQTMENRKFLVDRYMLLAKENPRDDNLFECAVAARDFMRDPVFYTREDVERMFDEEVDRRRAGKSKKTSELEK